MIKKVTILENDYIHKHNPLDEPLELLVDGYKNINFNVWDQFTVDIQVSKDESLKRLSSLSQDDGHMFLTYSQFSGGNNIYGWVKFLHKLKENNIRLNIAVIFGYKERTLLAHTLYIINDLHKKNIICEFKEVFKYHNIYTATTSYLYDFDPKIPIDYQFIPFTWDSIDNNLYKKGDFAYVAVEDKESTRGYKMEKFEVQYTYYTNNYDLCTVDLVVRPDLIDDTKHNPLAYKTFRLNELLKVTKKTQ